MLYAILYYRGLSLVVISFCHRGVAHLRVRGPAR